MNNIKILRNYILWFLAFIFLCIFGITHPKAYTLNEMKWLNRSSGDFPFTTNYNSYQYTIQFFRFGDTGNLPNFYTVTACDTGGLGFTISNVAQGSITYLGHVQFSTSCTVDGYNGNVRKYYFKLNRWDISGGQGYITYAVNVYPLPNWNVRVRFDNYEFSDTTDYEVLKQQQEGNQSIINSSSSNTNSIINNQNENTQDIIDNQNQNTQQQIESQQVCNSAFYTYNDLPSSNVGFLTDFDAIYSGTNVWRYSNYIPVSEGDIIVVSNELVSSAKNCFYDANKVGLSCYLSNSGITSIPSNAKYVRFNVKNSSGVYTEIRSCKNGNQAISDDLNNLNDSIKDDDIGGATQDGADFILDFDTNTFGLTSIITAPLNLIESLTSSNCSELELPLPFLDHKKLTLPCMTNIYQNTFGILFTMYQTITFGIIAYWVCVRIFNQVKDFKNPEHDEIEVVDL